MKNQQIALQHIQKDPVLNSLIKQIGPLNYQPRTDTFVAIIRSIVGQQLSGKAADTIYGRFEKLFPKGGITPQNVVVIEDAVYRGVGMSWAKARYVKDLASKVLDGTLQLNKLPDLTDEEVIEHLIKVKGIGRWSAEMILMFVLHRPDILPLDDLGIQNAFIKFFQLKKTDKKLKQKMTKLALKWQPYRTLASWYLWEGLDNQPLKG